VHAYFPGPNGELHGGNYIDEPQIVEKNDIGEGKRPLGYGWSFVPWGMRKILLYIRDRYPNVPIHITENGIATEPDGPLDSLLHDTLRVDHYRDYLGACHEAIAQGIDLRSFFAWTFLDNFEWSSGYTCRFGLVHVDFSTLVRTPKKSAEYYAGVIRNNGV
jgi:beta-glucosidase/6-phospho-beta-glucosidase/beta-galactosidase